MTGLTNYAANNLLNYLTGQIPEPSLPAVFLGLFTAVGSDSGSGFTEVSSAGTAYARVQVAGSIAAAGSWTTSQSTISMGVSNPGWVVPGMTVYDTTVGSAVGTVSSYSGTTLTLTATASHASFGSTDSLTFSAFPNGSGTAPSSVANNATINFAQANVDWGTVIAWGLFDGSSNLLWWDFMGNYNWLPFEVAAGSSPIWNVKANAYSSNDPVVITAEYGGSLPSASTGTFTNYNINYVASPSTDSIQIDTVSGPATPCVLTSSGSGMIRKITKQSIPQGVTASFAASTLTLIVA